MFKQQKYDMAVKYFTFAIEESPIDHTLYGNRSASYLKLGEF